MKPNTPIIKRVMLAKKLVLPSVDGAIRQAAVTYAKMGWPVIPLHGIRDGHCTCSKGSDCTRPGKHPALNDWVNSASTDPTMIAQWFKPGVRRNVGILTGARSGLMVVDVDPRNGGETSYAALMDLSRSPKTVRSSTGNGTHLFFKYDKHIGTSQGKHLGAGIDVRSEGGLVVAPPSRHISGKSYKWQKSRAPTEIAVAKIPAIWFAPKTPQGADLRAKIVPNAGPTATDSATTGSHVEGNRNNALTSMAGRLVNAGLKMDAVLSALLAENARACHPPLPEAEVRQIAGSVSRYAVHASEDEGEAFAQLVLERRFAAGENIVLGPDGVLWSFNKTHWSRLRDEALAKVVLECSTEVGHRPKISKSSLLQQVRQLVRAKASVVGDPLKFASDPSLVINVQNGELWIKPDGSVELKAHKASSYLRHVMDVIYDPAATCPKYQTAVEQIFGGSATPVELIDFWHEVCGYALQPNRRSALIVIGKGNGGNGKTVLTHTLFRLLGNGLVLATPVQEIDRNQFSTGNLLGKLVLVDDDVKSGTRLPDGPLKRISEEKLLTGEKKFGDSFSFISRVVPILLCNNFPSVADLSPGLQRRLAVIPFNRAFLKKEENTQLFPGIWQSEMSGILNLYLAGLKRVVARGWRFERPPAVEAATKEFLRGANPLPDFIASSCTTGLTKKVKLDVLYNAFGDWAKANGITFAQQLSSFKKNLELLGYNSKKLNNGLHIIGLSLNGVDF